MAGPASGGLLDQPRLDRLDGAMMIAHFHGCDRVRQVVPVDHQPRAAQPGRQPGDRERRDRWRILHEDHSGLSTRDHIKEHLGARKIEFISTAIICVVFAISFAHLEYYYIKDPALQISNGEVLVTDSNFDRSRETELIVGNMYQ